MKNLERLDEFRGTRTVGCKTSFGPSVPKISLKKLPGCADNKLSILTMKILNTDLKNHGITESNHQQ